MTNPYTYQKTVTTSGTPVQLQDQAVEADQGVLIKAKGANTGTICVGNSSANALNSDTKHFKLRANEAVALRVPNLNQIWIDASVNGEGVEIIVGSVDDFMGAGATPSGNGVSAAGFAGVIPMGFNDFNYDKLQTNTDRSYLPSAARTTTQTQGDQTNYNARGVKVVVDVTSAGTGSITLSIQGKDNPSGKYYTLLASAALTGNGTTVHTVYPGIAAAANFAASDVLPRTWRLLVTANNANSITYSVGYSVIL